MTLIEAAELLGLHPSTLRAQIERGRLPAKKIGRDWHVTAAAVERYRAERLGRRFGLDPNAPSTTKGAVYQREYRARRKAEETAR